MYLYLNKDIMLVLNYVQLWYAQLQYGDDIIK